jgi:hypothetical protein
MKNPASWFIAALLSFTAMLVIPYVEGRFNSLWSFPPMLPAVTLPFALLFGSTAALLRGWIRSLRAKRNSIALGAMSFISATLLIGSIVPGSEFFHRGFTDYSRTVLTVDEWRTIARVAQQRLGPEGKLPGPDKNLWDEEQHRGLWSDIVSATQIQRLDPSLMIFVRPETTEIVWGGALAGHRGVIIFTGKGGEARRSKLPPTAFIAEDIATIVGAD